MRGDPLWDYVDDRLDGDEPRYIIEVEELLGLDAWEREGVDRLPLCAVQVDFIDDALDETESATAGDTPLLARIHVSDEITQRVKPAKE